nr:hypothetical protein BN993_00775 [Virgibacillus halodenitrificans]
MKMIRHEAIGYQFKRGLFMNLIEDVEECFEITGIFKESIPPISATDYVVIRMRDPNSFLPGQRYFTIPFPAFR